MSNASYKLGSRKKKVSTIITLVWTCSILTCISFAAPSRALELIGLDHFAVNVTDLDRSVKWYSDVLGFGVLHKWSGVVMVGKGNIKVGLFHRQSASPIEDQDNKLIISHVAILVDGDKFDDALAEIKGKGLQIEGPEDTGIAYSFFFRDPDGHQIEFTTYHGKAPPKP